MFNLPRGSCLSGIPMLFIGTLGYPLVAAAQDRGSWDMPMMQGGWGIAMMLMMLLFWTAIVVAIIAGIRWLITSNRPGRQPAPETPSALDVLKERYARGDIGKEEFEEIRRDIQ